MASPLPTTMRAWQFASTSPTLARNLKLNPSAPLPSGATSLAADQVLVKVLTVSVNPVDYKFPEIPYLGRLITGSPAIPGIDFAGRVAATGPNSKKVSPSDLKVGQLVFGRLDMPTKFGTLAEYTIAPRRGCVALPSGVKLEDGASAASTALTAYQAIIPKIKGNSGERVFINGGSGGCGTFAIQIAKLAGCHVTTSCSSKNAELCKSLGADTVIEYTSQDLVAELKKMPKFDLVADFADSPKDLYWLSPSFTNPTAPFVQVAGDISFGFLFSTIYKQAVPSWLGGGQRPWEFMSLVSKVSDLEQIGQWIQEGKLKVVVDEIFGMEDKGPVKAYDKLRLGRTKGKIVVKIAEQ